VTCYTQRGKPFRVVHIMHYLLRGDESSPRGRWGICAPDLPEVLKVSGIRVFSVAHHDPCQSFLIGLFFKVTRARHVHLFPLPCQFGRSRITDSPHWLVYLGLLV
jgi:hypothetical protein